MKNLNFITLAIFILLSNTAAIQADTDVYDIKPAANTLEESKKDKTEPQTTLPRQDPVQQKSTTQPEIKGSSNEVQAPKEVVQTIIEPVKKEEKPVTQQSAQKEEITPTVSSTNKNQVAPISSNLIKQPQSEAIITIEKKSDTPVVVEKEKSTGTSDNIPAPTVSKTDTPEVKKIVESPLSQPHSDGKEILATPPTTAPVENVVSKATTEKTETVAETPNEEKDTLQNPSPAKALEPPSSVVAAEQKPNNPTPTNEQPSEPVSQPEKEVKKEKDQQPETPFTFIAPDKLFNAKSYKLDNGLQIVVFENKRAPVITHMVWYRVGSADETEGKSGIAHFLEHLMFKGQKDLKPGQFSKIIRSLGGQDNAFTSHDYTAYYQSVAKEHLETVMIMESGRMRHLSTPPEEFSSENKVIQEERRQRTDNDPRAQMAEQINAALFPNHRYGVPVIGWMHEIEKLTLDDAKAFYDRYYTPNNAILIVSGDVTGERVLELAKKTYGNFPARNITERTRSSSPEFIARQDITLTHATIKEPAFMRSYRVPSFRQNPVESMALQVLQQILSGGSSSVLYDTLVTEKKLAIDTSFSYDPNTWDDATFDFYAAHTLKISADKVKNAFEEELRNLIKKGIEDDVLADAKRTLQAQSIYALDSVEGPAMILGRSLITGMSLDDIEGWAKSIGTVTKEQVQAVAQKYLNPDSPYKYPPVNGYLKPVDNQ